MFPYIFLFLEKSAMFKLMGPSHQKVWESEWSPYKNPPNSPYVLPNVFSPWILSVCFPNDFRSLTSHAIDWFRITCMLSERFLNSLNAFRSLSAHFPIGSRTASLLSSPSESHTYWSNHTKSMSIRMVPINDTDCSEIICLRFGKGTGSAMSIHCVRPEIRKDK